MNWRISKRPKHPNQRNIPFYMMFFPLIQERLVGQNSWDHSQFFDQVGLWTQPGQDSTHLIVTLTAIFAATWTIIALMVNMRRRQIAETELNFEKRKFQSMVERAPFAIAIIGPNGTFEYLNPKFTEMFGYKTSEVNSGKEWLRKAFPDPDSRRGVLGVWKDDTDLTSQGTPLPRIFDTTCSNGERKTVSYRAVKLEDTGYMLTCEDVTEADKSGAALRESEEKYRNIVEHLPPAAVVLQDYKVVFVNPAGARLFGDGSDGEILGKDIMEIFWDHERAIAENPFDNSESHHGPQHGFISLRKLNGEKFPAEVFFQSMIYQGKPAQQMLAIDLTERQRADEASYEMNSLPAAILRSMSDAVICLDTADRILFMNKAAEKLTGRSFEDSAGVRWSDIFKIYDEYNHLDDPLNRVISSGDRAASPTKAVLKQLEGREVMVSYNVSLLTDGQSRTKGIIMAFRDISEKVRMQEEAIRIEKLDSLGILAGGIAHDFNNMLTSILGNLDLASLTANNPENFVPKLEAARKASLRAIGLTQRLLTFSRGGEPIRKNTSVSGLIRECAEYLSVKSGVQIKLAVPDDIPPAEIDEGQIYQVINNLIVNAYQAMPYGGIVKVSAEEVSIDYANGSRLSPGQYVKISIRDTGVGISRENLPKIFDPYFTTKPSGFGGLGLSAAYSIIRNHQGHISVESSVGQGTIFHVFLPASKNHGSGSVHENLLLKGYGKILLMDDDESIRWTTGELLGILGYDVSTAADGKQAIKIYTEAKSKGTDFAAVIMDLTIPGGMGGKETIFKMHEIDPNIKAIVSSGYSNDPIMANYADYGFKGVIAKPYSSQELGRVLHDVINGSGTGLEH